MWECLNCTPSLCLASTDRGHKFSQDFQGMSFSHGMARGLYRGYKNYTPWLTSSRDLAAPPGKGTMKLILKNA